MCSFFVFSTRSWLHPTEVGKPEQAFIPFFTHSFIQHLLYVRDALIINLTIGGYSLVGEIPMKGSIAY